MANIDIKLKRGMRVIGYENEWTDIEKGEELYRGTIFETNGATATVKRDDGKRGAGAAIPYEPYFGEGGWKIRIKWGRWGSDREYGILIIDPEWLSKYYSSESEIDGNDEGF